MSGLELARRVLSAESARYRGGPAEHGEQEVIRYNLT